jgi:hypothetical protein
MIPLAPIGFVRTVPESGDTVDGHLLPGGVSPSFTSTLDLRRRQKNLDYSVRYNVSSNA